MIRTLISLISLMMTLGLASAATATSLTVDTDKIFYTPGETITVTTTLVVMTGHSTQSQLLLQLVWNDAQIDGTPGPTTADMALESGAGFFTWTTGAGNCLSDSCLVLDQLSPTPLPPGTVPDAATITMTTIMVADAVGLIGFTFGIQIGTDVGAVFGGNAATAEVVPEPGTAALLPQGFPIGRGCRAPRGAAASG